MQPATMGLLLTTLFNYTPVVMETHADEGIIALAQNAEFDKCVRFGWDCCPRRVSLEGPLDATNNRVVSFHTESL